jgi:uncharacterized membrane protein
MRGNRPGLFIALSALVLVGLSAAAIALLTLRIAYTGRPAFAFLVWNLWLAWCPLVAAAAVYTVHRARAPWIALTPLLAGWLLLLPNGPYLVTDLIHLGYHSGVPKWFDAAMLGAFGASGLALGYASLYLVQVVVAERSSDRLSWGFVSVALAAASVGIYLGRVLRLNSWDAVLHAQGFARLTALRLADPLGNPFLVEISLVLTTLLVGGYLVTYAAFARAASATSRRYTPRRG